MCDTNANTEDKDVGREFQDAPDERGGLIPESKEKTVKERPRLSKEVRHLQEIRGFPLIEGSLPITPDGMPKEAIKGMLGGYVREMVGLGYTSEEILWRLQSDGGVRPSAAKWLVEIITAEMAAAADIPIKKAYQVASQSILTLYRMALNSKDIPAAISALKLFIRIHGLDTQKAEQNMARDWVESIERMGTMDDVVTVVKQSLEHDEKEGRLLDDEFLGESREPGSGRVGSGGPAEEETEDRELPPEFDVYDEGSGETSEIVGI